MNIYSLTVLEAGSLKSRCWQGHTPSKGSRGGPPLPLLISGGSVVPWLVAALFQSLLAPSRGL